MLFYADENFPLNVTIGLRNLGHDVLTALEDERANQRIPDEEVLERSTELQRALLTINRLDFKRIHNSSTNHAGIIICTLDVDFAGQAQRIDNACRKIVNIAGQLVRIYRPA